MKKILLSGFCVLFAVAVSAQSWPPKTNYYGDARRSWQTSMIFDSTVHIPFGSTPAIRTRDWAGPGAIFFNLTDSSQYNWSGYNWAKQLNVNNITPFLATYATTAALADTALALRLRLIDSIGRRTGVDSFDVYKNGVYAYSVKDSTGTQYTDADARAAISLTTTGAWPPTYSSSTGIFNISTPALQQVFSQQSNNALLTANDTISFDNGKKTLLFRTTPDTDFGDFHFNSIDTISNPDNWNSSSGFGLWSSKTYRYPAYSSQSYRGGNVLQVRYELKDSAKFNSFGGDYGFGAKSRIHLSKMAGYSGRSIYIGGTSYIETIPVHVSILEASDGTSTTSNYRYGRGWWSAYTGHIYLEARDTVENYIGFLSQGAITSTSRVNYFYDFFAGQSGSNHGTARMGKHWGFYNISPLSQNYFAGNTLIGDSIPDASALLNVTSTTKGVIWPRMTTVQKDAIASPATGLIVFDTDLVQYNFWDGDSWEAMGGGGGGAWGSITGTLSDQTDLQSALDAKISGSLTSTRIPFATGANTLSDDAALTWNNTTKVFSAGDGAGVNVAQFNMGNTSQTQGVIFKSGGVNKFFLAAGSGQSDLYMVNHSFRVYVNGTGNLSFRVAGSTGITYNAEHATTGSHIFQTATVTRAIINNNGLNLAEQSAPSTPATGLTSIYSTDGNVYSKDDAGTVRKMTTTLTRHGNVIEPINTDDRFVFSTDVAITITSVKAVLVGSSTPSVTYNITFDSDRSAAGTNVFTAGQTVTSTTTMTAASGVNDATIPAGSIVRIKLSAVSGTVGELDVSITYTED